MGALMRGAAPLAALLFLFGCGSSDSYTPNEVEAKAMRDAANLTPQQQLENAEKSGLPQDQKDALIKSIKQKHGLQ